MKIKTKLELKVDGYENVYTVVDHECPLGQLFDYACILQNFALQKMKEDQEKKAAQKQDVEEQKQPEEGVSWE